MARRKNKPTSIRLDPDLQEELQERCSNLRCSRNDFMKASIEFGLRGGTGFDFWGEHDQEQSERVLDNSDKPAKVIEI